MQPGGRVVALDAGDETLGRQPTDLIGVLGDDREGRLEQVGEQEVVETHQRDAVLQLALPQGPHHSDSDEVLAREKCGRPRVEVEQSMSRILGGDAAVQTSGLQPRIEDHAGSSVCLDVAEVALLGRLDGADVTEEADPGVAAPDQMLHRRPGTRPVVGDDGVGVEAGRQPVDVDQRRAVAALDGKSVGQRVGG